jgi:hypothetical protein
VGDHSTNKLEDDNYIGSGNLFEKKVKEYGKENFKRDILEFFPTKQEAFAAQEKYIILHETHVSQHGYNISWNGGHNVKCCISEETKKKISESHKGKIPWMKGKHHTPEAILSNKEKHIGFEMPEETKQKISNKLKDREFSSEHRKSKTK